MDKLSSSVSDQELFDLTASIQPARSCWAQAARAALGGVGVSAQLGVVILLIHRNGPRVSQVILAASAGVTPATLVRTIDQGEEAGLLVRGKVLEDRRVREIQLLPAGKKCAAKIEKKLTALRRRLLGDIPAEEVRTAVKVLKLLESRASDCR